MKERILRLPEVERRTGYKKSAIYQKMNAGEFPQKVQLGPRAIGWAESQVDGWVQARITGRNIEIVA